MSKDVDIVDILRRLGGKPSPWVKRAVLSRFEEAYRSARIPVAKAGFLRRPIPLYAVGVLIIIAAGIAFIVGKSAPERMTIPAVEKHMPVEDRALETVELRWEIARNDLL